MQEKLRNGLLALGLSPERIDDFLALVAETKDRVRAEGLVYRKREKPGARTSAAVAAQTLANIEGARRPGRTLRISYAGAAPAGIPKVTQMAQRLADHLAGRAVPEPAAGVPIGDEIETLRCELERDNLPDWQRQRIQQRIRHLRRLRATASGAAAKTAGVIEKSRQEWEKNPSRRFTT